MNTDKFLFSVLPQTTWRIVLRDENALDAHVYDKNFVYGFDSDRNYFPQELVDYVNKKRSRWFSPYRNGNNYLYIEVQRNGKWQQIFNWPMSKWEPKGFILPLSTHE